MKLLSVIIGVALLVLTSEASPSSPAELLARALHLSKAARSGGVGAENCYSHYLPILNEIANNTQTETANCKRDAQIGEQRARSLAASRRTLITLRSENVQSSLLECQNQWDALNGLSCIANAGSSQVSVLENISKDSQNAIGEYNSESQRLNRTRDNCIEEVSEAGQRDSNNEWVNLQTCLGNGNKTSSQAAR